MLWIPTLRVYSHSEIMVYYHNYGFAEVLQKNGVFCNDFAATVEIHVTALREYTLI